MVEQREPRDTGNDQRVDDLRQQLRALGYLNAGVDRFVLGAARSTRRPLTIAALAAVRIGLLAAALLGPAGALGIGTRLPGLVTSTRDAIVVALYLALLFGAAAAIVSFVVSLIVAKLPVPHLAGKARLVSRTAGTIVGAACLGYLTLWWGIANASVATTSPLWTGFALVIAVAISLLFGHVVAISAFAVLVASHPHPSNRDATRTATTKLTVAAAVCAFVGAAALLVLAAPEPPRAPERPALAVVSPGLRVKVLAIDGFDPAIAETLRAEGRVPTLARLLSQGVVRIAATTDADDPARSWTTIATGQPPDVHGVVGLETRRVAGLQGSMPSSAEAGIGRALRAATDLLRLTRPSTASGSELRVKTFWEVAAEAGLRPAVVNWWATWPAVSDTPDTPVVISDRATVRLERGGALDGEIAPRAVYERLRTDWPSIKKEASALMTALLPVSTDPQTAAVLRRAAEVDAVQLTLASRLDVASLDLLGIYLPGLDIAQHALMRPDGAPAPSTVSSRLEGLRGYYVYLDALLRDVSVPAPNELVFLLTQPGRIESTSQGLLAVAGARAGTTISSNGRAIDFAPTVLYALGVPVSRDLSGAPLLGVFSADFVKQYPVRQVDTYGQRVAPGRAGDAQPLDQEAIERLRSLGYVR